MHIVAQPIFAKVENQVLNLTDYYISWETAQAFKIWAENTQEVITEVYLERNGLRDSALAVMLSGMRNRRLAKFSLVNNDIGKESLELITPLMPYLKFLRLIDLKMT